jgi:exopolyphosphatase/guanosine-5'-triphosphate,3'-diphosphate pyrophosphatase
MRVDMIVVACCLIRYVLEKYPFDWIRVSTYALKEGVLAWLGQRQEV